MNCVLCKIDMPEEDLYETKNFLALCESCKIEDREDVEKALSNMFNDDYYSFNIEISFKQDKISITLERQYERTWSLNSIRMFALSELFGTVDISVENEFAEPGCPTCDWGSSYGFDIVVRNPTKNNFGEV